MQRQSVSQTQQQAPTASPLSRGGLLQRKCGCGQQTVAGGECGQCLKKKSIFSHANIKPLSVQAKLNKDNSRKGYKQESHEIEPLLQQNLLKLTGYNIAGLDKDLSYVSSIKNTSHISSEFEHFIQPKTSFDGHKTSKDLLTPILGKGQPLDDDVRQRMEDQFKTGFSEVRIFSDPSAGQVAKGFGARAFTHKNNIVFAPGYYRPHTKRGISLLAHELTHVVQQRHGFLNRSTAPNNVQNLVRLEREAERAEHAIHSLNNVQIREHANDSEGIQFSLEALRGVTARRLGVSSAGSLEDILEDLLEHPAVSSNRRIIHLQHLRRQFQASGQLLSIPQNDATNLERIYVRLTQVIPSWISVPDLRFDGTLIQPSAELGALFIAITTITIPAWVIQAMILLLILVLAIIIISLLPLSTGSDFLSEEPLTEEDQQAAEQLAQELNELTSGTATAPAPGPGPEPEPEEEPEPGPGDYPPPPPPPPHPRRRCSLQTGLWFTDPIPMTWYMPVYQPFMLGDKNYRIRQNPWRRLLPDPEDDDRVGVNPENLPVVGKPLRRRYREGNEALRRIESNRFKEVLDFYGFEWSNPDYQPDHVHDLFWEGEDEFSNLWPLDAQQNVRRGLLQNNHQTVEFCESARSAFPVTASVNNPTLRGRHFFIRRIANI